MSAPCQDFTGIRMRGRLSPDPPTVGGQDLFPGYGQLSAPADGQFEWHTGSTVTVRDATVGGSDAWLAAAV
jgi:hypothetical protein